MLRTISIVVPCYNEAEALPYFYDKFIEVSKLFSDEVEFELVFVNDGSIDATLSVVKQLCLQDVRIKYVSFSRNFGKEAAMYAGLKYATGDYVIIADADLQDPLELIVDMYYGIKNEGYDCVAARRTSRDDTTFIRSFLSELFYTAINKISKTKIVSGARDFRLMTRQMVDSILELKEYNRFSKGIFSFVGYNVKWLSYNNVDRVAGQTSWSLWSLFKYALEGIFSFSTFPLHIASFLGSAISLLSFIFLVVTIIKTLIWGEAVDGYPTLISVITFLGGIQLLSIGILSEYMAKLYLENKNRPVYIVKESNVKQQNAKEAI